MKTCPICNKKRLPDKAKYCPKCGAELEQINEIEEPSVKHYISIGEIVTIIVIGIGVFGIGFGVSYWLFDKSITECIIIGIFLAFGMLIYYAIENV